MMRYCLRDHLKVGIFGKLIRSHRDGGAFSQLRGLTSDFNWGDEETLLLISLYFFGTIWGLKSPRTPPPALPSLSQCRNCKQSVLCWFYKGETFSQMHVWYYNYEFAGWFGKDVGNHQEGDGYGRNM